MKYNNKANYNNNKIKRNNFDLYLPTILMLV